MEPVILINPFEVPPGREAECIAAWERARAFLERRDGYLETRLHRALDDTARFPLINVARWQSPEAFRAAVGDPAFLDMTAPMRTAFPHYPSLYRIIRD